MTSNLFNKRSWHFKRYYPNWSGVSLNSLLHVNMRNYVRTVINSLLHTYVFNGSLLITLIFLVISLDKIVAFFLAHWMLLLLSFATVCVKEHEFLQIIFHAYTKPADAFVTVHS